MIGPKTGSRPWEALRRGLNLTLEESTQLGADYFALVAATQDFREGTQSFIEKTRPWYRGSGKTHGQQKADRGYPN